MLIYLLDNLKRPLLNLSVRKSRTAAATGTAIDASAIESDYTTELEISADAKKD